MKSNALICRNNYEMNYYCSGTRNQIYNISYLWYSSIAVIVGVTVAIIVSLFTGKILICVENFSSFSINDDIHTPYLN